eukprot:TRINITY_DN2120_c0_g2_i1.p1 TRINITY_DN2120_c0_g2~~TRINITY_DN2120_c0_g2_i1.p1  ORF type:complete len:413 (+),score=82.17 TRINITY_DN2120_c0_g2_i1:125-1363(+)
MKLYLVILLFLSVFGFAKSSCANQHTCEQCVDTTGCHFCGDGACHAILSPYGCAIGLECKAKYDEYHCEQHASCTDCNNAKGCHFCADGCKATSDVDSCVSALSCETEKECVRSTPEEANRESINPFYGAAVIGLWLVTVCFLCGCFWIVQIVKQLSTESVTTEDDRYLEMQTFSALEKKDSSTDFIPLVTQHKTPKGIQQCESACCIMILVLSILATIFAGCLVYISPSLPKYSICNKSFDWGSAIDGIKNFGIRGNYEILMSVYNPNVVGVHISKVRSTFLYKSEVVGIWDSDDNMYIPPESITDMTVVIQLRPSLTEGWEMVHDFGNKALILSLDMHMSVSLDIIAHRTWEMDLHKVSEIDVNKHKEKNQRQYCKCKSLMGTVKRKQYDGGEEQLMDSPLEGNLRLFDR